MNIFSLSYASEPVPIPEPMPEPKPGEDDKPIKPYKPGHNPGTSEPGTETDKNLQNEIKYLEQISKSNDNIDLKLDNINIILILIFGFIVGYFLVKSFFDGYKI